MKPNEPKDPLLLDHEADGIKELDNNLPRWWVWLFHLCNIFAVCYLVYYHVLATPGTRDSAAEYQAEMKEGETLKQAAMSSFEASLEKLEPSKDSQMLAQGKETFTKLCSPCHGPQGQGLVGPNLCDDYWIHGPLFKDNLRIILNGNPVKGMVAWKGLLKPTDIHAVASYIYTLRGTKPPNPKPPENQAPVKPAVEFE